jgi:hypothetical protein
LARGQRRGDKDDGGGGGGGGGEETIGGRGLDKLLRRSRIDRDSRNLPYTVRIKKEMKQGKIPREVSGKRVMKKKNINIEIGVRPNQNRGERGRVGIQAEL